ncbi:metallophosphoesterase [Candidatus Entotheonella palauensis]|nr:hypothetical protein [Candidatus Entotheonella palauensis]
MIVVAYHTILLILLSISLYHLRQHRPLMSLRRVVAALYLIGMIALIGTTGVAVAAGRFHAIRYLAYVVFVYIPLLLLGLSVLYGKRQWRWSTGYALVSLVIIAIGIYAFFIEPWQLETNRFVIYTPKIERRLRIAIVADLQTDAVGTYEENALRRVLSGHPDLILMTGDYIQQHHWDDYHREGRRLNAILKRIDFRAPLGVYAVQGDTDKLGQWRTIFESTDVVTLLQRQHFDLGDVVITGLPLRDSRQLRITIGPQSKFHIVFGHAPDFSLGRVDADLLIAGHTHGGQVRLPFIGPLITLSRVPRAHAAGLNRLDAQRTLIVSRGIGMERGSAPRLRFLCRPEIVFVDLVPALRSEHR